MLQSIALNTLELIGIASSPAVKLLQGTVYRERNYDPRANMARNHLSYTYLRGKGVEIGALHKPLSVRPTVEVRYLDRLSRTDLREHYPELADLNIVEPDIVDNGETLDSIEVESLDFIIANHFIEHCIDPIKTIETHLGKLSSGGILYYAVPHRENTFDYSRPLTTVEHLANDYERGGEVSAAEHFQEFARYTKGVSEDDLHLEAAKLMEQDYSIHYHVWTPDTFRQLLVHMAGPMGMPFEVVEIVEWRYLREEFVVILRKL